MYRDQARHVKPSYALALALTLAMAGAVVSLGSATTLPGKGPSASECYVTLEVEGTKAASDVNKLECQDGDPTCDQDGDCHNNSCTFRIQACPNQPGISGCTPTSLSKLVAHVKGQSLPPPSLTGSACGALLPVDVLLKKKGKRPGKAKVVLVAKVVSGKPKVDKDKDTLICMPSSVPADQPCPIVTTTTVVTGSTTTTTTGGGPCACGSPDPTKLTFTTGIGSGDCGMVLNADGSTFKTLACGGLYFGGGQNSVPLPATVPDMGSSVTKVTSCSGTTLTLAGAANGELGATMRTCTKAGCFFGPPLPIPNTASTPTSTCVINTVSADASGSGDCGTGASNIDLPLSSEIFLTGDPNSTKPGIQPCPTCESGSCVGGPNNGMGCTPGNSASLGPAYPTSHDCPPDPNMDIGGLPIGFSLSTGAVTRTAVAGTGGSSQVRVFCGYCRDAAITGSFEQPADKCLENGAPVGVGCPIGFPACEQNNQGAFGPAGGGAKTITATGSPAGSLADHALHNSTLVSVFCIPPTFNATVDAAANLPGPGGVSLPGQAQLE